MTNLDGVAPDAPDERVDERDTMFARAARRPGTPAHDDYYARRPELRAVDDRLRRMPGLLQPGGRLFHPELSPAADRLFDAVADTIANGAAVAVWRDRLRSAADPGALIRAMLRLLGAVAVGFTRLDEAFVYSVKGRHDRDYGRPVELGRNNILIAERYGSRVRIGAVTTDLELACDAPVSLGADHFCALCRKCADNCPSGALATGGKERVLRVSKWPTHVERCYGYWRVTGTDCGVYMAVCPFSHRDTWFHTMVRAAIRRFEWCHSFALWCDDLIYGRRWRNLPGGREDVLNYRQAGE